MPVTAHVAAASGGVSMTGITTLYIDAVNSIYNPGGGTSWGVIHDGGGEPYQFTYTGVQASPPALTGVTVSNNPNGSGVSKTGGDVITSLYEGSSPNKLHTTVSGLPVVDATHLTPFQWGSGGGTNATAQLPGNPVPYGYSAGAQTPANRNLNTMLDQLAGFLNLMGEYGISLVLRIFPEDNGGYGQSWWSSVGTPTQQGTFIQTAFRYCIGYLTGWGGFTGQPVTATPVHNALFAYAEIDDGTNSYSHYRPPGTSVDVYGGDFYTYLPDANAEAYFQVMEGLIPLSGSTITCTGGSGTITVTNVTDTVHAGDVVTFQGLSGGSGDLALELTTNTYVVQTATTANGGTITLNANAFTNAGSVTPTSSSYMIDLNGYGNLVPALTEMFPGPSTGNDMGEYVNSAGSSDLSTWAGAASFSAQFVTGPNAGSGTNYGSSTGSCVVATNNGLALVSYSTYASTYPYTSNTTTTFDNCSATMVATGGTPPTGTFILANSFVVVRDPLADNAQMLATIKRLNPAYFQTWAASVGVIYQQNFLTLADDPWMIYREDIVSAGGIPNYVLNWPDPLATSTNVGIGISAAGAGSPGMFGTAECDLGVSAAGIGSVTGTASTGIGVSASAIESPSFFGTASASVGVMGDALNGGTGTSFVGLLAVGIGSVTGTAAVGIGISVPAFGSVTGTAACPVGVTAAAVGYMTTFGTPTVAVGVLGGPVSGIAVYGFDCKVFIGITASAHGRAHIVVSDASFVAVGRNRSFASLGRNRSFVPVPS
jgi:hypothetical protein